MKLTPKILFQIGFRGEGRDLSDQPAYRFEIPKNDKGNYYGYGELQIVLNDYPEDNPNCGILSLYQSEIKDTHGISWCKKSESKKKIKKTLDVKQWEDDEYIGGIKYVTFPERTIPIASYVSTLERLNALYTALTENPPFKIK